MANKKKQKSQKNKDSDTQNYTLDLWKPQPKQLAIIEKLIDLDDRRTKEEKCKDVGICKKTLYNWLKNPEFVKYMNDRLELSTDAELVDMWRALKSVAKRGNVQALRTFFELKGKLNNRMELTGKDGGPIETQGNVEIVFNMPKPPGKRETDPDPDKGDDVQS